MTQLPGNSVEPSRSGSSVLLGIVGGVVVAIIGPFVWYGMYKTMANALLPPLIIGVGIGVAMRLMGRSSERRLAIIGAALTVIACTIGYVCTDLNLVWVQPPTLGDAIKHLLNDMVSLLLIALGAYLAFVIAVGSPSTPPR